MHEANEKYLHLLTKDLLLAMYLGKYCRVWVSLAPFSEV